MGSQLDLLRCFALLVHRAALSQRQRGGCLRQHAGWDSETQKGNGHEANYEIVAQRSRALEDQGADGSPAACPACKYAPESASTSAKRQDEVLPTSCVSCFRFHAMQGLLWGHKTPRGQGLSDP